jgi:hypothetical protein
MGRQGRRPTELTFRPALWTSGPRSLTLPTLVPRPRPLLRRTVLPAKGWCRAGRRRRTRPVDVGAPLLARPVPSPPRPAACWCHQRASLPWPLGSGHAQPGASPAPEIAQPVTRCLSLCVVQLVAPGQSSVPACVNSRLASELAVLWVKAAPGQRPMAGRATPKAIRCVTHPLPGFRVRSPCASNCKSI